MTNDRRDDENELVDGFAQALAGLRRGLADMGEGRGYSVKDFSLTMTLDTMNGEVGGSAYFRREPAQVAPFDSNVPAVGGLRVARPTYDTLKGKYKCEDEDHSCSLKVEHSCAIRLSEALIATDSSWIKVFQESGKNLCDNKSVRGAQDLAAVLESTAGFGTHDVGKDEPNGQIPSGIKEKRGIIIYMGIPGYGGQGHIGLWNKANGACGEAYWDAKRVWFWELK